VIELKNRFEILLPFSKTVEIFLQLFFRAKIPLPDDDINPYRSPAQVVINAF